MWGSPTFLEWLMNIHANLRKPLFTTALSLLIGHFSFNLLLISNHFCHRLHFCCSRFRNASISTRSVEQPSPQGQPVLVSSSRISSTHRIFITTQFVFITPSNSCFWHQPDGKVTTAMSWHFMRSLEKCRDWICWECLSSENYWTDYDAVLLVKI